MCKPLCSSRLCGPSKHDKPQRRDEHRDYRELPEATPMIWDGGLRTDSERQLRAPAPSQVERPQSETRQDAPLAAPPGRPMVEIGDPRLGPVLRCARQLRAAPTISRSPDETVAATNSPPQPNRRNSPESANPGSRLPKSSIPIRTNASSFVNIHGKSRMR